jgi:hypothetical protein
LGVYLWAQAVEAAGTTDTPAIRQALRDQRFDAPGGAVRIDPENQHTWKTMPLGKIVEGGQFEIVWSSEKPIRPELIPVLAPRQPGLNSLLDFSASGTGTGPNLRICSFPGPSANKK